jgi:mono/diheme cytochrome c family protein
VTRELARLAAAALVAAAAFALARGAAAHGSHAGVIRGAVVYQRLCASCHGQKGHGDGPRAADGLARPTDLTALGERLGRFDRAEVAALVDSPRRAEAHGSAERPVWGDSGLRGEPAPGNASPESPQLKDLLDYLEHSQGPG